VLGKRANLDDVPDAELDRLFEMGLDWIWFLSVWQTGPAAQAISRTNPEWRRESAETARIEGRRHRRLRVCHPPMRAGTRRSVNAMNGIKDVSNR
jgi:hypothetical protein